MAALVGPICAHSYIPFWNGIVPFDIALKLDHCVDASHVVWSGKVGDYMLRWGTVRKRYRRR